VSPTGFEPALPPGKGRTVELHVKVLGSDVTFDAWGGRAASPFYIVVPDQSCIPGVAVP